MTAARSGSTRTSTGSRHPRCGSACRRSTGTRSRSPWRMLSARRASRTRCCASSGRRVARASDGRRGSPWSRPCRRATTSSAENMVAQDEAGRRDADDALFVGPDGIVLEAPTSNVWWREARRLFTPSLELPILAGVTRGTLFELVSGLGYDVEEGRYPLDRLLAADEAFLTSSVREVMPVVAVDGRPIGDGAPGPAAESLQRALRAAAGYPGE